ncbi:MAG: FABP family protein [Candidatus Nanopelagicales bacterium]|jgi:hypothetical protein
MSVGDLPEELVPLSWLIGRWAGVGLGQYPTIEDFRFGQEVSFTTDGRPFLAYASRSWLLNDDGEKVRPLATETGYWRPRPDGSLEVTMAHPTGYAELWLGTAEVLGIENATITSARATMTTDVIAASPSAKPYTAGERLYGLVNGELMWTYDMAAVEQPLTNHLSARLRPAE